MQRPTEQHPTEMKRRPLTPSARNIRILLVRSDPTFRQGTLDGLKRVAEGDFVTYEDLQAAYRQRT